MKKSATVPTSDTAKRIAAIMHRRPETAWNIKKEIDPFRKMVETIHEDDLAMVERYYARNWPPRTNHNHLRHDLATLINNWAGECDRARIWCEAHPLKPVPRKIIPLPMPPEQQATTQEMEAATAAFEKLMGRKPKLCP